ncbi:MAG: hypothetical protein OXB92_17355 [Acidimicrobiaceae bacterium]|nr:hypothetical protein [Acidimicrobiaceae bacterium]
MSEELVSEIRVRYLKVGDKIWYMGYVALGKSERFIEVEEIRKIGRYYNIKLKDAHWWELYETKKIKILRNE